MTDLAPPGDLITPTLKPPTDLMAPGKSAASAPILAGGDKPLPEAPQPSLWQDLKRDVGPIYDEPLGPSEKTKEFLGVGDDQHGAMDFINRPLEVGGGAVADFLLQRLPETVIMAGRDAVEHAAVALGAKPWVAKQGADQIADLIQMETMRRGGEGFNEPPRTSLKESTPQIKSIGQDVAAGVKENAAVAGKIVKDTVPSHPKIIRAVDTATAAHDAGYRLPPNMVKESPSVVDTLLSGWGAKVKLQQAASVKNQPITNRLTHEELGLSEDAPLNDTTFNQIREEAGKAYQRVKDSVPLIFTDGKFDSAAKGLDGANSQAGRYFPKTMSNPQIRGLVKELRSVGNFPPEVGLEVIKKLRFDAQKNLQAMGNPNRQALGLAQREAAGQIEDLIERNLEAYDRVQGTTQYKGLLDAYRAARQKIAKSYDVQAATNEATGDVSALALSVLQDKGRPLTGNLKTIADTATAFRKAMQDPATFGHEEKLSIFDLAFSAAALMHGSPGVAVLPYLRPAARNIVLSKPYQKHMFKGAVGRAEKPAATAPQQPSSPFAPQSSPLLPPPNP